MSCIYDLSYSFFSIVNWARWHGVKSVSQPDRLLLTLRTIEHHFHLPSQSNEVLTLPGRPAGPTVRLKLLEWFLYCWLAGSSFYIAGWLAVDR